MSDDEMLAWLRGQYATTHGVGFVGILREVADRLALLTARPEPPGKVPVGEAELAQLRAWVTSLGASATGHTRLLAAFDYERARADHAEAWCVACTDRDGYRAGYEAGVAKALAVVEAARKQHHFSAADALAGVGGEIERACGPASPPPYLASLVRLRRLGEALGQIAATATEPTSESAFAKLARLVSLARAALEEPT